MYTQVVVESKSAAMHHELFHLINSVVYKDTGHSLYWGHIHHNFELPNGIVPKTMVLADFHQGQALGIFLFLAPQHTVVSDWLIFGGFGQYLRDLGEELGQKFIGDIRPPISWSPHQEFDEYEHLAHIYWLCHIHGLHNGSNLLMPQKKFEMQCGVYSAITQKHGTMMLL
jgi:hypothetical protein